MLSFITGLPKWVYYAVAAVALLALAAWYVGSREEQAVERERAEVRAETAETAIRAERSANEADTVRQEVNRAAAQETRRVIEQAVKEKPDEAMLPAGPAVRAAIDSLRTREANNRAATD